jgi:hypothetical protein
MPGLPESLPPLSTFWPMPLHPARHTIEGNLVVKEAVHEQSDRGHGRLAGWVWQTYQPDRKEVKG